MIQVIVAFSGLSRSWTTSRSISVYKHDTVKGLKDKIGKEINDYTVKKLELKSKTKLEDHRTLDSYSIGPGTVLYAYR